MGGLRGNELAAEIIRSHDAAVAGGKDGYLDPRSGLWVFTARFLRERGWCCGSGCRHCPFGSEV